LLTPVILVMVKHENFKRCDQSGFCKRNRAYADKAASESATWSAPYRIDPQTLKITEGVLTATILKTIEHAQLVQLPLSINFLKSGAVRITVDEASRQKGDIELRHGSKARKERYTEASKWAIVGDVASSVIKVAAQDSEATIVSYGPALSWQAVIRNSPFSVDFIRDGHIQIKLNADGLMNMEHWRPKVEKEKKEPVEGEAAEPAQPVDTALDESTWWEETFGGNTDTKPRGPESIGLDITFPGYEHVFGIPEHTGPLSLKETRYESSVLQEHIQSAY
jgi:alpha 1,3-glucosidase